MSLYDFAREHGGNLLEPISEETIAGFEQRSGFKLPSSLRSFYLKCGGTDEFTNTIWRIWPFDEIAPLSHFVRGVPEFYCLPGYGESFPFGDYLAFCDALIQLPIYAVCANPLSADYGRVISLAGDNEQWLSGPTMLLDAFIEALKLEWECGVISGETELSGQDADGNSH